MKRLLLSVVRRFCINRGKGFILATVFHLSFWALRWDLLGRRSAGSPTCIPNTISYVFAGLGESFIGDRIDTTGYASVIFSVSRRRPH
ncbi:hypothetical protein B0G76_5844 [Paraburkholderia sp. BL23I1N1]|uniref:hypothetical protein n=1 Tax=Paraburkholderia sp. BL23I1N1 TaxID=1938802 RepID=UPI000FF020FF|nr:hypothetical protein [Paraburkholderia sp. BL23I1N1]RKE39426.1 hypothetical protein B0G76_5844 [Paraburkholderia sp. BL23I1N1]